MGASLEDVRSVGIISWLNWSKQERKASWKRGAWGTENLSRGAEACEDKVRRKAHDRERVRGWEQHWTGTRNPRLHAGVAVAKAPLRSQMPPRLPGVMWSVAPGFLGCFQQSVGQAPKLGFFSAVEQGTCIFILHWAHRLYSNLLPQRRRSILLPMSSPLEKPWWAGKQEGGPAPKRLCEGRRLALPEEAA